MRFGFAIYTADLKKLLEAITLTPARWCSDRGCTIDQSARARAKEREGADSTQEKGKPERTTPPVDYFISSSAYVGCGWRIGSETVKVWMRMIFCSSGLGFCEVSVGSASGVVLDGVYEDDDGGIAVKQHQPQILVSPLHLVDRQLLLERLENREHERLLPRCRWHDDARGEGDIVFYTFLELLLAAVTVDGGDADKRDSKRDLVVRPYVVYIKKKKRQVLAEGELKEGVSDLCSDLEALETRSTDGLGIPGYVKSQESVELDFCRESREKKNILTFVDSDGR
ncbi:hypothetical protein F5887DRAFT_919440 [Amanita rubescens]|nr:hypothetical protein F5887DRAFT_919440 [Amanita rubescens]